MGRLTVEKHKYFMSIWEPIYSWLINNHYPQYTSFDFTLWASPPLLSRALKESADRLFENNFEFDESKYFIALYKKAIAHLVAKVKREHMEAKDRFEKYSKVCSGSGGAGEVDPNRNNIQQEEQRKCGHGKRKNDVLRKSSLQQNQESLFRVPQEPMDGATNQ